MVTCKYYPLRDAFKGTVFDLKVGRRFGAGAFYGRHWTPVHLDFVVADIESAVQRAIAGGALLEGTIATQKWGRLALMADPFGYGFCLLQFLGAGYDEIAD